MKVLVTGANGFVGRGVVQEFRKNNVSVVSLLRGAGGENGGENATFIGDFRNPDDWRVVLKGIDVVVHLIARTHNTSEKDKDTYPLYQETNVAITEALCDAILESSVRKLIFLSSIKVNGECTFEQPHSENSPENPEDNYGRTKQEAELLIKRKFDQTNADYIIIRPPLIYGTPIKGNLEILLKLIRKNVPFPFKCVRNARSLINLETLSKFIVLVAKEEDIRNELFLVAENKPYSTIEVVEKIAADHDESAMQFCLPRFFLDLVFKLTRKSELRKKLLLNLEVDNSKARQFAKAYDWGEIFETNEETILRSENARK